MHCTKCGSQLNPGASFCAKCGNPVQPPSVQQAPLARAVPPAPAARPAAYAGAPATVRRKKTNGCLIAVFVAAGIVVFLGLLAGGALLIWGHGLLEKVGLAPRDLGVKWTQQDYNNMIEEIGVKTEAPPKSADRSAFTKEFIGQKDVDWNISENEMTAWMNDNRPGYWPFRDVQVKFHEGNVIEVSGNVDLKKLLSYPMLKANLTEEDLKSLKSIPLTIPVYMKGQVNFPEPRKSDIHLQDIKITGIEIPEEVSNEFSDAILSGVIDDMFGMAEQVSITSFATGEGTLELKGTWYEEMKRIPTK